MYAASYSTWWHSASFYRVKEGFANVGNLSYLDHQWDFEINRSYFLYTHTAMSIIHPHSHKARNETIYYQIYSANFHCHSGRQYGPYELKADWKIETLGMSTTHWGNRLYTRVMQKIERLHKSCWYWISKQWSYNCLLCSPSRKKPKTSEEKGNNFW